MNIEIAEIVLAELLKNNKDYRESYHNNPASLTPYIEWREYETDMFVVNKNRIKKLYFAKNATTSPNSNSA